MKEFDFVIIGGGCAGLSLAYELEINGKLKNKTLAIIENRKEYKRDRTWSFWKVFDHNFDDCVIKSWNNFTINTSESSHELRNKKFPYQSIDSGKFYNKISSKLSTNSNVSFHKNINEIKSDNSIKNYKINFTEKGAIPLFCPSLRNDNKVINIGSAGGMTRLSTGYTFLNIQEHSKYIVKNIDKIDKVKIFNLGKKYQFLDKVFLRVLEKHPEKMPKIFFNMFKTSSDTIIKFLSNKSNFIDDINIISKMPKLIFLKALFN